MKMVDFHLIEFSGVSVRRRCTETGLKIYIITFKWIVISSYDPLAWLSIHLGIPRV